MQKGRKEGKNDVQLWTRGEVEGKYDMKGAEGSQNKDTKSNGIQT